MHVYVTKFYKMLQLSVNIIDIINGFCFVVILISVIINEILHVAYTICTRPVQQDKTRKLECN